MNLELLNGLPGESLVRQGLADRDAGRTSIASCLIEIASPKLERLGLIAPKNPAGPQEPELVLYRLLRQEDGDAFSRYQAFLRQLASFERALETRHQKQAKNAIACGGKLSISN